MCIGTCSCCWCWPYCPGAGRGTCIGRRAAWGASRLGTESRRKDVKDAQPTSRRWQRGGEPAQLREFMRYLETGRPRTKGCAGDSKQVQRHPLPMATRGPARFEHGARWLRLKDITKRESRRAGPACAEQGQSQQTGRLICTSRVASGPHLIARKVGPLRICSTPIARVWSRGSPYLQHDN